MTQIAKDQEMIITLTTSILKVLLKQYMSPTGPNKYLRGITPAETDKLKRVLF